MKTLAPAARVWSPGAAVLGAARPAAGARGRHSGPRHRGPGGAAREPTRRPRLPHLQPLARRGRRSLGGCEQEGKPGAASPEPRRSWPRGPGERPSPSARRSVRRSVYALRANAAAADAGGDATRQPAGSRAPSHPSLRPPLAPPAWPAAPPPAARSSARRPPPAARARPGARAHGLGCSRAAVAPRSRAAASFHRSPLRPLPLSPPLLWPPRAPATPERLQRDGGGRRQAEGRGRAPGSTPIESSLAE